MKVVIYCRVSTEEQVNGYSIEAQEDQCRSWAAQNGYRVVRVYIEPGRSARTDQRPQFQRMIALVKMGLADAVLIHKSDRIARNLLDLLHYRNQLERAGKKILSVLEPFFNDDSPESRMVVGIIGSINEFYSANLSREVRKGQGQKAKSGKFPGGKLPLGYARDEEKNIIIDQERAAFVISAFHEFATGDYTLKTWAKRANDFRDGIALHPQSWLKIFRNIFYLGRFVWGGEEFQGDHSPLLDNHIFQQVQSILDERDTGGSKNRNFWLFAGLVWSTQYQTKMTGSLNRGRYAYYRAKGSGQEHFIKAEDLEAQVMGRLNHIRGFNRFADDKLRLAMTVATSMADIFNSLKTDHERRDFLRLVIDRNGIIVEPGGAVSEIRLHPNFEVY